MQAIDAIYDWLDHLDVSPYAVAMRLYQDDQPLLDQGEGFPGALMLSSAEYRALQECWKRHALPADLYFPADQERIVIEPVKGFGGVYRAERRYTPRQWAERIPGPAGDAQMPSEDERARALVGAWATFSEALMLRILQLSEPEVVDEHIKERNDLAKLYGQVQSMLRKAPSLQPYLDRRVEQDSQ